MADQQEEDLSKLPLEERLGHKVRAMRPHKQCIGIDASTYADSQNWKGRQSAYAELYDLVRLNAHQWCFACLI